MQGINFQDLAQGGNLNVSLTQQEPTDERKSRIMRENITFYAFLIGCFIMAGVLLAIVYNPPTINGVANNSIQENAFKAFVLFFTSTASLLVGRKIK